MAHAEESECAVPGACGSGRWEVSGRANGSPGACLPCVDARRQRRATPGAGTGEAACCTGAEAGGMGSTAACASAAGSRGVGHSADGDGTAHKGCSGRASVSGAAERSTGMGAPFASGPGGMAAHPAEDGLASWATGGDVASMSGAGQHDQTSNLRGNGDARGGVGLREAPNRWATRQGGCGRGAQAAMMQCNYYCWGADEGRAT